MSLVERARAFALEAHGDQDHGSLKIKDHLFMVTHKIKEQFPYSDLHPSCETEVIAAGWLHDVLEDTPVTKEQLEEEFGYYVASLVMSVTDGIGANRYERHLNTYWRTRQFPAAVLVKMCDRWHNQHRSIVSNEKRFAPMYAREYTYFKFALYTPGFNDTLWKEMDNQHKLLKNID